MVLPFMTLYLTEKLHYTIGQAGFVVALFGCGAICGGFLGGKLTDKVGFYYVQLLTLIGGGIMFMLLGQMTNYTAICITTFILSLVNESFRPANSTAIAHYSKEENRTRSYSLNRLAINIGWACGGALGGFIAAHNYHLLFWIDGVTNVSAAIMLWFLLAPSKNKTTKKEIHIDKPTTRVSAYKDKPYIAFIILTTLYAYSFFQIFSTMPVFFKEHLGLNESFIGLVMAVNGLLIALFEMVVIHNLEGRRHNLQYIFTGTIFLSASLAIFNIMPGTHSLALASMLLSTIGEMLTMPFMNSYWISRTNNNNRGQYAGLYTISWSVAQVLGPATGSQVAGHIGFTALWWMTTGFYILSAIGFRLLQKKTEVVRA